MKQKFLASLVLGCSIFIASCGGGGSGSSSNPATPGVTQTDVLNIAKVGALYNDLLTRFYSMHILFAAGYLQGFSSSTGGTSSVVATACSSGGSLDITVSRTGTYTGLHAGDSITTVFHQCNLGNSIADGTLTIIPSVNYASLTAPYSVQFILMESNLLLNISGNIMRGNLAMPVTASVSANGDYSYSYTASSRVAFDVFISGNTSPSISMTDDPTNGSASVAAGIVNVVNNGMIGISVTGASLSYQFSVSPALSGPLPAGSSFFIPTSGAFRMSQMTSTPAGSSLTVTVNGATVNIAADTNGDGASDMSFATTYASLLAP